MLKYTLNLRNVTLDGRNMALRGDDIVAFVKDPKVGLKFLKGESKSRAALSTVVIEDAARILDRDRGRPTRHSVLFVANRLREEGQDLIAKELENAVLRSFRGCRTEHLLCTLSGNSPENHLLSHLKACRKKRRRYAIGVRIRDLTKFIECLYTGL